MYEHMCVLRLYGYICIQAAYTDTDIKCHELSKVQIKKIKIWSIFNVAVFDVVHSVQRLPCSKDTLNINEGIIAHI